jgi:hypothetical protein
MPGEFLVAASVGYLQVLMLLSLLGPISIFYNTIRDATGADSGDAGDAANGGGA